MADDLTPPPGDSGATPPPGDAPKKPVIAWIKVGEWLSKIGAAMGDTKIGRFLSSKKVQHYAIGGALLLNTVSASLFNVEPNEQAVLTRYGKIVSEAPVGPGLHVKWPYLDSVEVFRADSLALRIDAVGPDGQKLAIEAQYRVPAAHVAWLLKTNNDFLARMESTARAAAEYELLAMKSEPTLPGALEQRQRIGHAVAVALHHGFGMKVGAVLVTEAKADAPVVPSDAPRRRVVPQGPFVG